VENKIKLIYPELSYKIVGILYDVFNELKAGHKESYYQRAIALELQKSNIYYFPCRFLIS